SFLDEGFVRTAYRTFQPLRIRTGVRWRPTKPPAPVTSTTGRISFVVLGSLFSMILDSAAGMIGDPLRCRASNKLWFARDAESVRPCKWEKRKRLTENCHSDLVQQVLAPKDRLGPYSVLWSDWCWNPALLWIADSIALSAPQIQAKSRACRSSSGN